MIGATSSSPDATAWGKIAAWCVYDWGNSAFPAIITTFVFAPYFVQGVAANEAVGTAQWGWAVSASAIAVAFLSPPLGAIADAFGRRKPWLGFFTIICVVACFALWWVRPLASDILYALIVFAIANTAFELAIVFYNAMLPSVAPRGLIGRVSGWAWGLGYMGGLACLVFVLFAFVQTETPLFGLDKEMAEHARIVGPISAFWYAIFALPLFFMIRERSGKSTGAAGAVRQGLATLWRSLVNIRHYANIARYLGARMIYTDGLNTLFAFGGIYAAGTFGMELKEVIIFGICLNLMAGLGAAGFAWVDDLIGAKHTILIGLVGLIIFGTGILVVEDKTAFWILGLTLGVFFGPVQAGSRSLLVKVAPEAMMTEMFGLYSLSGKATAFFGPLVLGWVTLATNSQRAGMATVLVFFVVGGVILLTVREEQITE
jgi:UMF1 family MFS transporter